MQGRAAPTSAAPPAATTAAAAPAAPRGGPSTAGLSAACDKLSSGPLAAFEAAAGALTPDFQPSSTNFAAGVRAMLVIAKSSQQRGRPSVEEWQTVAQDLAACMTEAGRLGGGPRTAATNHNKALEESFQGLLWVTFDCSVAGAFRSQLRRHGAEAAH